MAVETIHIPDISNLRCYRDSRTRQDRESALEVRLPPPCPLEPILYAFVARSQVRMPF